MGLPSDLRVNRAVDNDGYYQKLSSWFFNVLFSETDNHM